MSDFDTVYTVKREVSQEQFMRQLLINLAKNYDTPNDICTASFGEVRECEKEVILCGAHVETNYSASVGYDRKEEYWDKEKRTTNGVTHYVDVKKVRTVTDWSPYTGHTSGDAVCAAFNEDTSSSPSEEHNRIVPILKSVKTSDIVEKGDATLSQAGLNRAKKNCISVVEDQVTFPGDHVKDRRINSTASINDLTCYKTPFYEVDFKYNDKSYSASGFACGMPNAESELPPNNVDIKGIVNKETKPWKIGIIAGWVLTAATFIISCIIGGSQGWFWAIFGVCAVAAIVVTVLGNSKYNKLKKALESDNASKKLLDLQAALARYGYDKLSDAELSEFH